MKKRNRFHVITLLSGLGILLAVYLLYQQVARPEFSPCRINSVINCDAIISGEVSKTLGIPTPLYGLTGYVIIFVASLLKKKKLLFGMAAFGLAFCLWIAYRELFQLHVICPLCILCQLIMITIFVLSFAIFRQKNLFDS